MSESVVRVDLRQATLSESARLREGDDATFLALDAPPPVRSLLRITEGDSTRAFEVGRVIEVVDEDEPTRGCYGSFVDNERLDEQIKVGSEHLEPGISGGGGVPAPVVVMNTADMMLGEAGEDGEEAAAAAANDDSDSDGSESEGSDDDSSDDSDDGDSSDDGESEGSDDGESESAED